MTNLESGDRQIFRKALFACEGIDVTRDRHIKKTFSDNSNA